VSWCYEGAEGNAFLSLELAARRASLARIYEPIIRELIIYEPIFDNRFIIMVLFMNRFLYSPFVEETIYYEPIFLQRVHK